jgi:NAD(P)-dependent dehydrogenase (short-subunit alcohol dehydrogenase family)
MTVIGQAPPMTDQSASSTGTIVITGAAGGMGRACVTAFQHLGPLLLLDVEEKSVREVAEAATAAGGVATALVVDVSSQADVDAAAAQVAAGGGLRTLIHTAGISPTMADGRKVLEVDLVGTARLTRALLPLVGPGTVAVCVASIGGQMGPAAEAVDAALNEPLAPDFLARLEAAVGMDLNAGAAYALAKRGVISLCEREAPAWGAQGGRIVSISPGLIDTPMGRLEAAENEGMAFMLGLTPVKRPADEGSETMPGRVADIAAAAVFLASPAASFVSGCDLRVDGGLVGAIRHLDLSTLGG